VLRLEGIINILSFFVFAFVPFDELIDYFHLFSGLHHTGPDLAETG
jgi:hypothetical protein